MNNFPYSFLADAKGSLNFLMSSFLHKPVPIFICGFLLTKRFITAVARPTKEGVMLTLQNVFLIMTRHER